MAQVKNIIGRNDRVKEVEMKTFVKYVEEEKSEELNNYSEINPSAATSEDYSSHIVSYDQFNEDDKLIDESLEKEVNLLKEIRKGKPAIVKNYQEIDNYHFTFSKGLKHDKDLYPKKEDMDKFHYALINRDMPSLRKVPFNSLLIHPSYIILNLSDKYVKDYRYYSYNIETEKDMIFLYAMSLARDVPFSQYNKNSIIIDICKILNNTTEKIYYPSNVFYLPHDCYVSQFLFLNKFSTYLEKDYLKNWESLHEALEGKDSSKSLEDSKDFRQESYLEHYIKTGRDLAFLYQNLNLKAFFEKIFQTLISLDTPHNKDYDNFVNSFHFEEPTFDFQNLMNKIEKKCQEVVYYLKWNKPLAGPESYGKELERVRREQGYNKLNFSQHLLYHPILQKVKKNQGTYLLSQTSTFGSEFAPMSPCYKTVFSSAVVILLSLFFNLDEDINVLIPSVDGDKLIESAKVSSIHDELMKLVKNITLGGCWAGELYSPHRYDNKLGEKIALHVIEDEIEQLRKFGYEVKFKLQLFNGKVLLL